MAQEVGLRHIIYNRVKSNAFHWEDFKIAAKSLHNCNYFSFVASCTNKNLILILSTFFTRVKISVCCVPDNIINQMTSL